MKFSDCLDHFSGNKKIGELDGMNCIDEVLKEKDYEQEYREVLIYFIKNFNIIINNKKFGKWIMFSSNIIRNMEILSEYERINYRYIFYWKRYSRIIL